MRSAGHQRAFQRRWTKGAIIVITRTPYRVSLFGGGLDFPAWYEQHGAQLVSFTIDKYCLLSARWLPPFHEHRSRIVWSKVETVRDHGAIEHPSVRACLQYLGIDQGVEIHHDGDLPARSGLGSSSAFTVGLLHALHALHGRMASARRLAAEAIHVEQALLREAVGMQDQIAVAHGGVNLIRIAADGSHHVKPLILERNALGALQAHLMLFYTRKPRSSSGVQAGHVAAIPSRTPALQDLADLVEPGAAAMVRGNMEELGRLLDAGWQVKRAGSGVSTPEIDDMYALARRWGAWGGKVLGAGGGGFMLFCAPPAAHPAIRAVLGRYLEVPFKLEFSGSRVIFYDPQQPAGKRLLDHAPEMVDDDLPELAPDAVQVGR